MPAGRPKLDPAQRRTNRITFHLTDKELAQVEAACEATGRKVRHLIMLGIEAQKLQLTRRALRELQDTLHEQAVRKHERAVRAHLDAAKRAANNRCTCPREYAVHLTACPQYRAGK